MTCSMSCQWECVINPMSAELFYLWNPRGLFRPRTFIANNASLDHGRNLNFWEKIALCMIFPTRYHTFLYLTWFGRNGQSPRGGQMRFVGDLYELKVNPISAGLLYTPKCRAGADSAPTNTNTIRIFIFYRHWQYVLVGVSVYRIFLKHILHVYPPLRTAWKVHN